VNINNPFLDVTLFGIQVPEVSEKSAASIFRVEQTLKTEITCSFQGFREICCLLQRRISPEDGNIIFLRNVGTV
jgi:hypothetical protein